MLEFKRDPILRASLLLSLALLLCTSAKAEYKPIGGPQAPFARIEKIVVDGDSVQNPGVEQVKVVRASGKGTEAGQVGLELYENDQLITANARVILTSLNNDNKQRQVVIGRNTSIVILRQSVLLKVGRLWARVAGAFTVRTIYWVLGVPGTEFQFTVVNSNNPALPDKADLAVLSGAVDVSLVKDTPADSNASATPTPVKGSLPKKGESLRVGARQEVNLVKGENLPSTPQPISTGKLKALNTWINRVDSARKREETPPPRERVINLFNVTTEKISEVYLAPADNTTWGVDRLGNDNLAAGATKRVDISLRQDGARWDLRIVDGQNRAVEWRGLELMSDFVVTLSYRDGKYWINDLPPKREGRIITVYNETPLNIKLHLSPTGSESLREDTFDNDILVSGKTKRIYISPRETGARWDLAIIDHRGHRTNFRSLDLVNNSAVILSYRSGRIQPVLR